MMACGARAGCCVCAWEHVREGGCGACSACAGGSQHVREGERWGMQCMHAQVSM